MASQSWLFGGVAALALASLGLAGCIEKAVVPPIRQGVDATSKQQIYEDFKLTYDKGIFSENWIRRDGAYNLAELENVISMYPETRANRQDIIVRRLTLGTVGGVGAGIMVGTLTYNLTATADQRMSSSTQTTLYVAGGGLFLASIIMQVAWHDPAEELADIYNRSLATDLGIAPNMPQIPGGPPPVRRASSLKPRFVLAPTAIAGPRGTVGPGVGAGIVF